MVVGDLLNSVLITATATASLLFNLDIDLFCVRRWFGSLKRGIFSLTREDLVFYIVSTFILSPDPIEKESENSQNNENIFNGWLIHGRGMEEGWTVQRVGKEEKGKDERKEVINPGPNKR